MINFCPECGVELKENFKFCPNCGYNLENTGNADLYSKSKGSDYTVIICDNCGEENDPENEVCAGCGVKLQGEKVERHKPAGKQQQQEKIKKKIYPHSKPQVKRAPDVPALDTKKVLIIFGTFLIIAIIILISSGVFDSPTIQDIAVNNNINVPQGSGIDLANINRINELEKVVNENPSDTKSLLDLAHLLNDSGFYEKAINRYQQYLENKPEDADARIDMGVCYYNLQQYDNAIAAMTKALEYEPQHQIGHLNLGIVNLSAGNLEVSREWLKKAVDINPNSEIGKRASELLQSH